MAWSLGSTLSLAALANDRSADQEHVAEWFKTAREQANLLGVSITDLPPRPAANQTNPQAGLRTGIPLQRGPIHRSQTPRKLRRPARGAIRPGPQVEPRAGALPARGAGREGFERGDQ